MKSTTEEEQRTSSNGVLSISGSWYSSITRSKQCLLYSLQQVPGRVLPALPARCLALALLMNEVSSDDRPEYALKERSLQRPESE